MELIIEIPEVFYEYCKAQEDAVEIQLAVKNGIPLPKGHGDIVDIETLIDMFWDGNSMEITKYDLSVIEPIIEADKAESEEV